MTTLALDKQLAFWYKLIFSLSPSKKRVAQYFYSIASVANKKKWKSVYPKIRRIAFYAKCSTRSVQRFIKDLEVFGLTSIPRFCENGRQTSNAYYFPKQFLQAMSMLDRRHLLNAPQMQIDKFFQEFESKELLPSSLWMSPSPSPVWHPYSSSSSPMHIGVLLRGELKKGFYPCLEDIEMTLEAKIGLSGYPERSIVMALEDLESYKKWKGTPKDIKLFLAAQAARHSGTRPKRNTQCANLK